jgi:hypothetical protein
VQRLVALGLDPDRPDREGLTPVQIAGWEGLPEAMVWLLSLGPDLNHVNGYGGSLLDTIVHGSENTPARSGRDHIGCARLALEAGVALPEPVIRGAGDPDLGNFLRDWAAEQPEQVTSG